MTSKRLRRRHARDDALHLLVLRVGGAVRLLQAGQDRHDGVLLLGPQLRVVEVRGLGEVVVLLRALEERRGRGGEPGRVLVQEGADGGEVGLAGGDAGARGRGRSPAAVLSAAAVDSAAAVLAAAVLGAAASDVAGGAALGVPASSSSSPQAASGEGEGEWQEQQQRRAGHGGNTTSSQWVTTALGHPKTSGA